MHKNNYKPLTYDKERESITTINMWSFKNKHLPW